MKKKSIVVTLALALTLTALTGCGSKDSVTAGKSEVVEQETGKSKDKVKADKVETDKTKADKNEDVIQEVSDNAVNNNKTSKDDIEKLLTEAGMDTSWAEQLNNIVENCDYGQIVEVASAEGGWGEVKAAVFEDGTTYVVD